MTSTFYFIETNCEIDHRIKLERLGQKVNLSQEMGETAIKGGAALLPEDKFQAIGFTADELKDYAYPGARVGAPADFAAKMQAARVAVHDYRLALEGLEGETR